MQGRFFWIYLVLFCGPATWVKAIAQEPAFAFGHPVVRYEQSPGFYNYVFPCSMPTPSRTPGAAQALCWPALVGSAQIISGKLEPEHLTLGLLMISSSLVRFFPGDNKSPLSIPDLPMSQMAFTYYPEQRMAAMLSAGGTYAVAIQAYCSGCDPAGQPRAAEKAATMGNAYRDLQETLTDFYAAQNRIGELAEEWRVEVNSKNQPGPNDPSQALLLYSKVNRELSSLCGSDQAKLCVEEYAQYQACRAVSKTVQCIPPPTCSSACPVSFRPSRKIDQAYCIAHTLDYATFVPKWADILDQPEQDRPDCSAAVPAPLYAPLTSSHAQLQDDLCSPSQSFQQAYVSIKNARDKYRFEPGKPDCIRFLPHRPVYQSQSLFAESVEVSANDMAQILLLHSPPQYPPAAEASRIEGTVQLGATITEIGFVGNLRALSYSGSAALVQPAMEAVRLWTYRPYLVNERPVEVHTKINIVFALPATASDRSR